MNVRSQFQVAQASGLSAPASRRSLGAGVHRVPVVRRSKPQSPARLDSGGTPESTRETRVLPGSALRAPHSAFHR